MTADMNQSVCCRVLPQPQDSFRLVLLVSLLSWAPSPASSARSTGLQLGTDAGMSSVLLTMVGSQCGNTNLPAAALPEYVKSVKEIEKKILLLRLTQASWLHAKGTSLQKQVYRGRTVLYIVGITRGSLLPSSWPLCLCVALPHPLCVALRKATCDKSGFFKSCLTNAPFNYFCGH